MTNPKARIPLRVETITTTTDLLSYQLRATATVRTMAGSSPSINRSVEFLVDTGACYTVIHHMDAELMGLPLDVVPRVASARSASGNLEIGLIENVDLLFDTDSGAYGQCRVRLPAIGVALLPKRAPKSARTMPSLLGMDVIACFAMLADIGADEPIEQAYMAVFDEGLIHVVRRP